MLTLEQKIDFLIERVLALEFALHTRERGEREEREVACAKTQTPPPVQMCNSPTQTGLI